jgi:hypothetical protein
MRRDVDKIVFERPKANRTWASKTPREKAVILDVQGDQINEGANHIRRKRQKMRNSSLNVLERFLVKRVGRPWDTVYAEVCAVADARSFTGAEVRDYLKDLVASDCWLEGRTLMCRDWRGRTQEVSGLYIDPRSGLLLRKEQMRKRKQQMKPIPIPQHLNK